MRARNDIKISTLKVQVGYRVQTLACNIIYL
jgi:hypothetical protein